MMNSDLQEPGRTPNNVRTAKASDTEILRSVLFYVACILGGPILAFFATRILLLSPLLDWNPQEVKVDVVSAIVASKIKLLSLKL